MPSQDNPLTQPLVPDGGVPWHEAWRRAGEETFAACALEPGRRERILWFLALACAVVSWLVRGYTPTRENGGWHLPMLHAMVRQAEGGPPLFPGDPFVLYGDSYHSLLWTVISRITASIRLDPLLAVLFHRPVPDLDAVLAVFYGIQLVLLHYAVGALAYRLARNIAAAGFASLWFVYDVRPALGGSFFMNEAVSHTAFSVPLLLLAAVAAIDRRWWLMGLLWGLGGHVHLPNSVYISPLLLYLAAWNAAEQRRESGALDAKGLAIGAGVAAALFVPLLWRFLGAAPPVAEPLTWGEFRALTSAWVERHIYIEGHYGPKYFPETTIAQGVGMLAITFALTREAPRLRPFVMGHWLLLLPVIAGVLGASVLESKAIARLMLLRAGDFLMVSALLVQLTVVWPWMRGHLRLVRPLLPLYVFAIYGAGSGHYGDRSMFWLAAGVVVVSHVLWRAAQRPGGLAARASAMAGRLPLALRSVPPALAVLVLGVLLAGFQFNRVRAEVMRANSAWRLGQLHEKEHSLWAAAQVWAAKNTPEDALFLVPFSREYFRLRSFRPCYLDLRDANNVVLGDHVGREILRRLRAMGITAPNLYFYETYPQYGDALIPDETILRLAETEGVDYAVLPFRHPTRLPAVYFNQEVIIVKAERGS
jgi:hypothetical protein